MSTDHYVGLATPLAHPGEHLREDFLTDHNLTVEALSAAMELGSSSYMHELVCGHSPVTADIALRLARVFDTTAEFWMNLQTQHDLSREAIKNRTVLNSIQPINIP